MTAEKAIEILSDVGDINRCCAEDAEALDMAIKALEQQQRDCNTCKHSDNGNCAYTEECHECMWKSKYEQQPCEDCISRQALIEKATSWDKHFADSERCVSLTDIQNAPSVTPQSKISHWINLEKTKYKGQVLPFWGRYECSKCGGHGERTFNYCPNCGAKMRESEDKE